MLEIVIFLAVVQNVGSFGVIVMKHSPFVKNVCIVLVIETDHQCDVCVYMQKVHGNLLELWFSVWMTSKFH